MQIDATVETVLGFGEVAICVLGKVEGVIDAPEGSLEIAQDGVDRAEAWQCRAARGELRHRLDGEGLGAQTHQLRLGPPR